MKSDKDLYRQLRTISAAQLWEEQVPLFDQAAPAERMKQVAIVRAVGVVFAESGTAEQKIAVRTWLTNLLKDPNEKIRRYAMAALPKIGAGRSEEEKLLSLLKTTQVEREKKSLGAVLEKIGGAATLATVAQTPGLLPQTEQKVKANVAREESPSTIRLDRIFENYRGLRIHLRCRKGLETIVRDEVKAYIAKNRKFRLLEFRGECVAITPTAPFSIAELFTLRCFDTIGFGLGVVRAPRPEQSIEPLAQLIASPLTRQLLQAFTEGSLRYRLDYVGKGHQRGAVRLVANRAYELCPDVLNDARQAPWAIDLYPIKGGCSVELRPKLTPDPRLFYRTDDVWAASHPPLAACMARLAALTKDEIVWDPFCGSGLELIECALLGGVKHLYGTDVDPAALKIAKANFAAAKLTNGQAQFTQNDFRDFAKVPGLGSKSVSLIITNPPMGRRVRVPNLHGMVEDLFFIASQALKPGGRLIFVNPLRIESTIPSLKLHHRSVVDLGGFDCRLEVYHKSAN